MIDGESIQIVSDESDIRLDHFLVRHLPAVSRTTIQQWIRDNLVLLNGAHTTSHAWLRNGDIATLLPPPAKKTSLLPLSFSLSVIYEDDHLLVIDKPAGLVVHPAVGHAEDTLLNAVLAYYPQLASLQGQGRFGLVHRLDKDTSGLLILAKHHEALQSMLRAMQRHQVIKRYFVLVHGSLEHEQGTIDAPLGRSPRYRQQMAIVSHEGKNAVTHFQVLERFVRHTYMQILLETGRTHQIRVHLLAIGHAVVGDRTYGHFHVNNLNLNRQFLHAASLEFLHPVTKEPLALSSPLPSDLQAALTQVRDG